MRVFQRWRVGKTSKQLGDDLEIRVENIFKRLGKWNVQRNVKLIDPFGNESQIDVTYGYFWKTYVECKNYSTKTVPLADVAKFKEVLVLNNISPSRGLFITTSTFVPRAVTVGVKTIDGKYLLALERKSKRIGIIRNLVYILALIAAGLIMYELRYSN